MSLLSVEAWRLRAVLRVLLELQRPQLRHDSNIRHLCAQAGVDPDAPFIAARDITHAMEDAA
jgi:hypothetical protein